ncbi:MGDG synthase family glycosyltransferase [Thermoflexus sp.]|uniref:MGDG synthase family glycosyltransferase n=1 Tax=Thermoflexus sp. TaxID=1969742 RepID=UPI002ADDBCA5|nr:glycosyltransferase [Thermoflexus sp.]
MRDDALTGPEATAGASSHVVTRVLLLMSDTGGGHRSVSEALAEGLRALYGPAVEPRIVDAFIQYAPFPLNRSPALYPYMVKPAIVPFYARAWHFANHPRRARQLAYLFWPWVRDRIAKLFAENPADVIVSVHPLFNDVTLRYWMQAPRRVPFVIVICDIGNIHALWCANADLVIAPHEGARRRTIACGVPPERVVVTGFPIRLRFREVRNRPKTFWREQLGWRPDLPTVLVMGGGEGMGKVFENARAVAESGLPVQMAVVAGRNERLRRRLAAVDWPIPTYVYGFVRNIPEMMAAADLLITKAGPNTIAEALAVGRPMILTHYLPGQEEGNVDYVVNGGAGVYAPEPEQVKEALREWLTRPGLLEALSQRATAMGYPDAALDAARWIWEIAHSKRPGSKGA